MSEAVLVTGAYGFVGRAVVHRLAAAGHEVVALTSRPAGEPLPPLPVARTVHADIRDEAALRQALRGVGSVCHLAALTQPRDSFDQAEAYRAVNAGGTRALLAAADGPLRMVLTSTYAVYGTPEQQPVAEDAELRPGSPYAESKVEAEQVVREAAAGSDVGAVVVRPFNVTGAVGGSGDRYDTRLVPRALAVAAGRFEHLDVIGDGSTVRDFVHVDDLARAYVLALDGCRPGSYDVYNVGATAVSVAQMVEVIERVTERELPVRRLPPRPEAPVILADTGRIRSALGWKPERSGLLEMVEDAWAAARP